MASPTNNYAALGIIGAILAALLGWGIYDANKPKSSAAVGAVGCNSCGAMNKYLKG